MNCIDFGFDRIRSEVYAPSPVVSVRFEQLPNGGYKYNNDVRLLFMQERLRKLLGADSLSSWLGTMDSNYRSKVDTSKLPDHVVLDFVKSRHIQSPSELMKWSEYLNNCADKIVSDYQAEQERIRQEQEALAAQAAAQASQQSTPQASQGGTTQSV